MWLLSFQLYLHHLRAWAFVHLQSFCQFCGCSLVTNSQRQINHANVPKSNLCKRSGVLKSGHISPQQTRLLLMSPWSWSSWAGLCSGVAIQRGQLGKFRKNQASRCHNRLRQPFDLQLRTTDVIHRSLEDLASAELANNEIALFAASSLWRHRFRLAARADQAHDNNELNFQGLHKIDHLDMCGICSTRKFAYVVGFAAGLIASRFLMCFM